MNRPTFSIIIPTYNRPEFLGEAVASVLAQTRADWECLVIDDASPASPTIAADPRITLIRRSQNGGPAAARNTGLEQAKGQYIAFLDDDDLYLPNRLELALDGLNHAPIALCWSRFIDHSVRRKRMLRGNVYDTIVETGVPCLGATTILAECALPFDERFSALQDTDWWLRMSRDTPVWTTEQFGYVVRKHPGVRHVNDAAAKAQCTLLLLEKHADYFASHPRAAAVRLKRLGVMARRQGDFSRARWALMKSFLLRPRPGTLGHLIRSLRPSINR